MASTAGLFEEAPVAIDSPETQPLLGRSSEVIQQEKPVLLNLVTGGIILNAWTYLVITNKTGLNRDS